MASHAQPALWRDVLKTGAARSGALLGAAALFLACAALALALASYRSGDPSFNTAAAGPAGNLLGGPGALAADLLFALWGAPAVMLLPLGFVLAARLWRGRPLGAWRRMIVDTLLGVALMGTTLALV
ncbi:MAG: DNA translocase FtsK, partial [Staphylococcus hominis]